MLTLHRVAHFDVSQQESAYILAGLMAFGSFLVGIALGVLVAFLAA
jgi:hypothetical protein